MFKLIKYPVLLFIIISTNSQTSLSQSLGEIKIGTYYDEDKWELIGEDYWFNTFTVCYVFETYSDYFNCLSFTRRIIKIKNDIEEIYSTTECDVDPEWNIAWDYLTLPKGEYKMKMYSSDGKLVGSSYKFIIY